MLYCPSAAKLLLLVLVLYSVGLSDLLIVNAVTIVQAAKQGCPGLNRSLAPRANSCASSLNLNSNIFAVHVAWSLVDLCCGDGVAHCRRSNSFGYKIRLLLGIAHEKAAYMPVS